ncbi:DUF418 domain-containing protein [Olivibacter sitiensis]|uniref:DUF418 domain-containing protein n=1 Tax=Olivibacter sitiensis TaxID=376470 RepID=UPI00040D1CE3|nr:DUF418 domain-containing protein [Olivibacter sitiensis]
MEQDKTLSTPLNRITVLDALRGFALLGVILMHMLQHYSIFSFSEPREPLYPAWDEAIRWIGQNVISGRFINIFAFLFGLSFFIQMDRASRKGIDFRLRFIWRMVILFVIGLVGNCFYSGEIISLYAVFGIIMVLLYKVRSWILMILVSLLLLGTPRILKISYDRMTRTEQPENIRNSDRRPSGPPRQMEKPSFANSVKHNFTRGLQGKLNYQFGLFSRGYITLALFILGLVVGRTRYFEEIQIPKGKNLILFGGSVIAVILINSVIGLFPPPDIRAMMTPRGGELPISSLIVMTLNDINTVVFSMALVTGFILLYHTGHFGRYLDVMSPYGRMGLTNYEVQSVIGGLLFSMWAFGPVFGNWGPTEVFALGIAVYILQLIYSRYWLRYFLYGPLEWFWRSATYLKAQPFRRKTATLR